MDHPIAELSGGQKAKIFLLKMSMSGANVLILDEPTRNFSPLSGPVIREMLKEFPGQSSVSRMTESILMRYAIKYTV